MTLLIVLVFISPWLQAASCWRQWTWNTNDSSPTARRGHSFVTFANQLIVFGGRAEDTTKSHLPKTYEVTRINGSLEFLSYEDKIAYETEATEVSVAVFFNDIWSYDLNCTRYADNGCVDSGWKVLNSGAEWGGCKMNKSTSVCTHPSERWMHSAEVISDNTMVIYGGFGPMCADYCSDLWLYDFKQGSWTEMIELDSSRPGPGKRYKHSSVVLNDKLYVFGGFRLWHGFAHENSEENDWSGSNQYPRGGYLNDLWVYDPIKNTWMNITEKVECSIESSVFTDGIFNDIDIECEVTWPPGRAGHTSAIYDNAIIIHGGYRTFFPYPTTTSAGAGRGTRVGNAVGFTPYPTHPYYLSDMWKFNITTGIWTEVIANGEALPAARVDHSLVVANDVFLLFGGYMTNYYFDDTWQYNASANHWVEQHTFVHPIYPASCMDDLQDRRLPHSGGYAAYVFSTLQADNLNDYLFVAENHYGTKTFSVFAEPTRGSDQNSVFIQQARRQAPGWDGCRNRIDGREDLPALLQYEHPSQRSGHKSVYYEKDQKIFVFGGYGYEREETYHDAVTFAATSVGDLWQYDLNNCIKNCSLHGTCLSGNCRCNDGYYGEDCSNFSCPGSFCTYVDTHQTQICTHCCFSGYEHTSNDSYVENVQKYPCLAHNVHYSNGICDGFGMCICKPPFIGDDCSIRNCANNCSGHGYCSVEFPNSRCMCDEGWYGKYCDTQMCLNNCSYPKGECINGSCYCAMVYEPYNKTLEYFPFMGEDCSYLIPFAGAISSLLSTSIFLTSFLGAILI